MELIGNAWTCDCDLMSVYNVVKNISCSSPRPGSITDVLNTTACETTDDRDDDTDDGRVVMIVTLTVTLIMILTMLGVGVCRYHDTILSALSRLVTRHQCHDQLQDSVHEQFLHISGAHLDQVHHHHLYQNVSKPIPVTEL